MTWSITLTKREAEILSLIAQGKANKEIARVLDIAERTIEQHLTNSYRKLGVSNRTEAAIAFLRPRDELNLINRGDPLVASHNRH